VKIVTYPAYRLELYPISCRTTRNRDTEIEPVRGRNQETANGRFLTQKKSAATACAEAERNQSAEKESHLVGVSGGGRAAARGSGSNLYCRCARILSITVASLITESCYKINRMVPQTNCACGAVLIQGNNLDRTKVWFDPNDDEITSN
jgi:hypothetical protein